LCRRGGGRGRGRVAGGGLSRRGRRSGSRSRRGRRRDGWSGRHGRHLGGAGSQDRRSRGQVGTHELAGVDQAGAVATPAASAQVGRGHAPPGPYSRRPTPAGWRRYRRGSGGQFAPRMARPVGARTGPPAGTGSPPGRAAGRPGHARMVAHSLGRPPLGGEPDVLRGGHNIPVVGRRRVAGGGVDDDIRPVHRRSGELVGMRADTKGGGREALFQLHQARVDLARRGPAAAPRRPPPGKPTFPPGQQPAGQRTTGHDPTLPVQNEGAQDPRRGSELSRVSAQGSLRCTPRGPPGVDRRSQQETYRPTPAGDERRQDQTMDATDHPLSRGQTAFVGPHFWVLRVKNPRAHLIRLLPTCGQLSLY
jgi:hypothetical protein